MKDNTDIVRTRHNPALVKNIDSIRIGERHRREMGDIDALARSIEEIGLLHPVVVTPENVLIAGQRRLAAVRMLGWAEVPVTVVSLDEIMKGERDENTLRKDFTPSEAVAIGRALEEREREKAKARETLGKIITGSEKGRTRDIVGNAVGMSGATYEAAKTVVIAAEEDPEVAGPILEEMDRTGKVHTAVEQLRIVRNGGVEPKNPLKTRAAIDERHAQIKEMALQSYRPEAIAAAMGLTERNVRKLINRWGIPTVTQRIGKAKKIRANEVMDSVVMNAGPTDQTVNVLFGSWDELDETRFAEWDTALTEAIQLLTKLRNRIRKDMA